MGSLVRVEGNTLVVTMPAQGIDPSCLAQRLGASHVLLRGEYRAADAELMIEFLKLDPSDGALELDARWSFVCTVRGRPAVGGRTQLQVPLAAARASAVAAAMVDALSRFSDVLAARAWCGGYLGVQDYITAPVLGIPPLEGR